MVRFLDWLDEAAGGLIRITYLLAGITAVAVYFGAGALPPSVDLALNAALPWLLAFSLETHTYLTARRVRAAWQEKQRQTLRVNLAVLVGLIAFSAWNQLNYLADTWTPPQHTALALPLWLAYLVRALVVPLAFLAAAFLAPLAEPVTAQVESEARATLADVFKIARKQRRRMLREAAREGRDMTGALVELVPDPEVRRIISHAYNAIRPAPLTPLAALTGPIVQTVPAEAILAVPTRTQEAAEAGPSASAASTPERPPTGPGSPIAARRRASKHAAHAARVAPLTARPRVLKLDPERRIRTLLAEDPDMSIRQLAKRARVSESTASKYRRLVRLEAEQLAERTGGAKDDREGQEGQVAR